MKHSYIRKIFFVILLTLAGAMIAYGGFFRTFLVYDNLEKFDQLRDVGITLKLPGMQQQNNEFVAQSQRFSEPEIVKAVTFEGVGRYKDGRLMSNYPDLKMLKERRPCPT